MELQRYYFANQLLIFRQYLKLRKNVQLFSDTRLDDMPLMGSPLPMLFLSSIYLFIVGMGKKWLEHRQPMQIDRIIIVYNVMQIIANSMFVLMVGPFVEHFVLPI